MGVNSDEQLARQLQQQEFEAGRGYSRQAGIPVVVGQPIAAYQQNNQVFQGQPMNNMYYPSVTPEIEFPPEFDFVPRLAIYVKTLAILDIIYVGFYVLFGLLFMVIVLPLPILGYLGAKRYNSSQLIWYLVYLVIITALRAYVFFAVPLDPFSMTIQIISLISGAVSLYATGRLYGALRKLNSRTVGTLPS